MNEEQANTIRDDMCKSMVTKRRLLLTVDVHTEEEAEEILRWMYAQDKPMKATLQEIAWDKTMVPAAVAEAVETFKRALLPTY